jgi:CDP-diacylglycerol--serine O-phosphatidyltransferase
MTTATSTACAPHTPGGVRAAGSRRRYAPRSLTLGNAIFGFLAMAALCVPASALWLRTEAERMTAAVALLGLSLTCDALDGRVARRLGVASPLGGELDSLADAVSFGVAPALIVLEAGGATVLAAAAALAHLAATLYRLARFNTQNDPSPGAHRSFLGLPCTIPAAAIASSAALIASRGPGPAGGLVGRIALPLLAIALAGLMASRLPYAHVLACLEGRPVALGLLAAGAVAVFATFGLVAVAVAALGYAASGPVLRLSRWAGAPRLTSPSA